MMRNLWRIVLVACAIQVFPAWADVDISFDTLPLVGQPAGPFYFEVALTDGSGIGDANNTMAMSSFDFGGGSALGNPIALGGVSGSLETRVSMTDSAFLALFIEQFAPGLKLSFTLASTSQDDITGIPDGFNIFLLDNSGVAVPTLAPAGDYFIAGAIGSGGTRFTSFGSDPTRPLSDGNTVTMPAPSITPVAPVPEPSSFLLVCTALLAAAGCSRCRKSS